MNGETQKDWLLAGVDQPQDTEAQKAAPMGLGVAAERTYIDRGFSGKTLRGEGLHQAFAALGEGGVLGVPRLDRFARNAADTLGLVGELTSRGVTFPDGPSRIRLASPVLEALAHVPGCNRRGGGWLDQSSYSGVDGPLEGEGKVFLGLTPEASRQGVESCV